MKSFDETLTLLGDYRVSFNRLGFRCRTRLSDINANISCDSRHVRMTCG
jgi:hypothetical protein